MDSNEDPMSSIISQLSLRNKEAKEYFSKWPRRNIMSKENEIIDQLRNGDQLMYMKD